MDNTYNVDTEWTSRVEISKSIDLQQTTRAVMPIGEDWIISITPQKSMFNFLRSRKKIDVDLTIMISELNIDGLLVVDSSTPLLVIRSEGDAHNVFADKTDTGFNIHMNDTVRTFSLFFNESAVKDIVVPQSAEKAIYPISFYVNLIGDDGTLVTQTEVIIKVSGAHIAIMPKTSFKFVRNMESVKYDANRAKSIVGHLKISNPSNLSFAPAIDVDVELNVKKDGDLIGPNSVENPVSIKLPINNSIASDDSKGLRFHINSLMSDCELVLPVYIDYPAVGNPVMNDNGEAVYNLTANVRYYNDNEPNAIKSYIFLIGSVTITKNSELPTLKVNIADPGKNGDFSALDNDGILLLRQIRFSPGSGLTTPIAIRLDNLAAEGFNGAGIYIENMAIAASVNEDVTVRLRGNNRGVNTLFQIQRNGENRIFLPNSKSSASINIVFDGNNVGDIYRPNGDLRDYAVKILLTLSFDYYLDEFGEALISPDTYFGRTENRRHYKSKLSLPIYQMPNNGWLAIDFGTSAVVAKYKDKLLDLHAVKRDMPRHRDEAEDVYEIGTPFLSSNIILRNVNEDDIEGISQLSHDNSSAIEFSKLALFLSPTSTEENANIDTVIPCLKLIVGYDLIPNIDNYVNYRYQYKNESGDLVRTGLIRKDTDDYGDEYETPTPLARIDTIFSEVYNQLMRYYIRRTIEQDIRRINKLILTVPNTYTPLHLQRIENIVRKALKDVNLRAIRFVSESDAVACYYQRHWTQINKKIGRRKTSDLLNEENVLVYDIGAGTLDVTLFSKTKTESGEVVINVIGKIGVAKAGNYMDALIATLLSDVFPDMKVLVNPKEINEASRLKRSIALKNFIKNEIKPRLSADDTQYSFVKNVGIGIKFERNAPGVSDDKESITYDLRKIILNHPDFIAYINSITKDLMKNFFNFFNIDSSVKIDTVLLSGRSAKLKSIKEALDAVLKEYGSSNMRIIPISSLNESDSEFDISKTIVVEGASYYADLFEGENSKVIFHSPILTAHYGIIYTDLHGQSCYVELLNPSGCEFKTGEVFSSRPVKVDLRSVNNIKLVQTFSSDTAGDWNKGDHEYITVMAEIDVTTIPDCADTNLSIDVDNSSYMTLRINGQQMQGITTLKVDINSTSNSRSLWPTKTR